MTMITRPIPTLVISLLGLLLPQSSALGLVNKQQPVNQYSPEVVSGFINSCTEAATSDGVEFQLAQNICSCYIYEIQNMYTFEQFETIDRQVAEGQPLPPAFQEIVSTCINRYVPQ
ncbi:MAG: hypothetical protein EA365_04715 [Gloeocapsa sp. DLM2.Bin57]|nr:MAG: hypothetical protein EA365_04715 [Gloeocapsa sp. DLM2.Bin57]